MTHPLHILKQAAAVSGLNEALHVADSSQQMDPLGKEARP